MKTILYICVITLAASLSACRDREAPYENPESPIDDVNDWRNDDLDNDTGVTGYFLPAGISRTPENIAVLRTENLSK